MDLILMRYLNDLKVLLRRKYSLAVCVMAFMIGGGGAMITLYTNGHWQLESHAQEIAGHFHPTWMGTDQNPIPRYSRIRKRIVFHNREAGLFKIVGLRGTTTEDSLETLLKSQTQSKVDFQYQNHRYQLDFSTREPLSEMDVLRFGATTGGLISAFGVGLLGWGVVWVPFAGIRFLRTGREKEESSVPTHSMSTKTIIDERQPESKHLEYKEVLRWNSEKGDKGDYCNTKEHLALKNIASFLNTEGGTLLVGVSDGIHPITEERDQFETIDDAKRHLENIMRRMSPNPVWRDLIDDVNYDTVDGHDILRIDCLPSEEPVFLADVRSGKEKEQRFYKRTSAASPELEGREMSAYIRNHFEDR